MVGTYMMTDDSCHDRNLFITKPATADLRWMALINALIE